MSTTTARPAARNLVLVAALLGCGALFGALLRTPNARAAAAAERFEQTVAMLAITQSRSYDLGVVSARMNANGAYPAPSDAYLIVTEWAPEVPDPDNPPVPPLIEVGGAFRFKWRDVRNGVVIAPGEFVRNANPYRVQMYGYVVDPRNTRTIADLDKRLASTSTMLEERLVALENQIGSIDTGGSAAGGQSGAEMIDVLSTAMGREVGAEVGRSVRDALDEILRRMDRRERRDAARGSAPE